MLAASIESVLQQFQQLPLSERHLLKQLLIERNGQAGLLAPEPEVSLAQAAEILNVSVAFVERLIAQTEIRQTSAPPAIKLAELLAYKKRSDAAALAILDELTAQAQELKLGYE